MRFVALFLMDGLLSADEHTLRMLLATDSHLGFNEKDGIRGDDSFRAFEEVFKIALENHVCSKLSLSWHAALHRSTASFTEETCFTKTSRPGQRCIDA